MKETHYAVREDLCLAVRRDSAKLIRCSKEQGTPFKLRFDKIYTHDNVYLHDSSSEYFVVVNFNAYCKDRQYERGGGRLP